jgi:hypothetical protein
VSPLKKVLMTLMVLGAMGTTLGAGTFASFNASTTSGGSTFQTGTLVLTDQKDTASACYSTGGAGGSTDNNANGACTALFDTTNASIKRPGDVATVDLTLQNLGTLSGTVAGFMPSACTDGDVASANYNGTASTCQNAQFAMQEYTSVGRTTASVCRYGAGASAVIAGTALTPPITIDNTSNTLKLTLDGIVYDNITLTNGTTYTPDTLAAEVQTKIRAVTGKGELVAATTGGKLQISSATTGATSNVTIATPGAGAGSSALTKLGFTSGNPASTSTGNLTICSLSAAAPDATHTLSNYLAAFPTGTTGLAMGTLSPNQSRWYRITMLLPTEADNLLQGRKATFSLSWTIIQS